MQAKRNTEAEQQPAGGTTSGTRGEAGDVEDGIHFAEVQYMSGILSLSERSAEQVGDTPHHTPTPLTIIPAASLLQLTRSISLL